MSALIRLIDASKRYGDAAALHPTNLSIERGKNYCCDRPERLRKINFAAVDHWLNRAGFGSIEFDGASVTADNVAALRRRIGYVIQEGGLFPHLTARANVVLMARHVGRSQEEMQSRLLELCELTRFSDNLLPRYPVELSGGQRQRVSLMRALMLSPQLLLLDETTRRTGSARTRCAAKGSQGNFRAFTKDGAVRHSRLSRGDLFRRRNCAHE